VLDMSPKAVRLGRLNQGAAVLDSHNWSGIAGMLGGIVPGSARLAEGALIGRIKFSRGSALAQRIAQDLQDGIQIPLSIGYKVHETREDRRTNPVTRTATDWEPIEVSVVPIAAEESGTGFRACASAFESGSSWRLRLGGPRREKVVSGTSLQRGTLRRMGASNLSPPV
jgi:hypothetical protein